MTTTRKPMKGNGKQRVYHHEFEAPIIPATVASAPITIDQKTVAQVPLWRIIVIVGAIVGASVSSTAYTVWWFASDRAASREEIISIKTDVKNLTAAVSEFKETAKDLSANLKWLSNGTWTRNDTVVLCKNLEAQNARIGFKCPAFGMPTGSIR